MSQVAVRTFTRAHIRIKLNGYSSLNTDDSESNNRTGGAVLDGSASLGSN